MKNSILFAATFLYIVLYACSTNNGNDRNNTNTDTPAAKSDTTKTIRDLVIKWNETLIKRDTHTLKTLYAIQASSYGTLASKTKVISAKQSFFGSYPDFSQSITGDILIGKISESQYKATFPKHSTYGGKTGTVQAYLIFENSEGGWKINNESDDITDKNISERQKKHENDFKKKRAEKCLDIVMEILTTSPAYKKKTEGLLEAIIKNGGNSYGLMLISSPNPEEDEAIEFSETYEISLHESYTDRMPAIGCFQFDPKTRQLGEYDFVSDSYIPIDFDRSLLKELASPCK